MNDLIKFYKKLFAHWQRLILGFFTMFLYALFSAASITMAKPVFDDVFTDKQKIILYQDFSVLMNEMFKIFNEYWQRYGMDLFDRVLLVNLGREYQELVRISDPMLVLKLVSVIMIILILLKNCFFYLNKVVFSTVQGQTIKEIRNEIYQKYLYHSLSFYKNHSVGDAMVRVYTDARVISDHFITSFFNVFRDVILLAVYARLALLLNAKLFLYSLVILPLFSLFISYVGKKIKKYAKRLQNQSSQMFSNVEEILNGIKVVKVFAKEEKELDKFKGINEKYYRFWRKSVIYGALNVPLSELNGVFTGVIVLLLGGTMMFNSENNFSSGDFMAFLLAVFSMLHPIKEISKSYSNIKKAMVSLRRVNEILDVETSIKDSPAGLEEVGFKERIEFNDISFAYEKGKWILNDIFLKINKGEKIALVGNSGSGKTTLSNLLPRLFDVTKGVVKIDDIPIKNMKIKSLRSLFGIVTQESILFRGTVRENIEYGSHTPLSLDEIKKAAKIAYADEFIDDLEKGYDTLLSGKASNLSGGQRQRLCIARAVAGNPPILIFDEATSALDTIAENKVQKAIEQATVDRTVIIIAHRLSTILSCDKIVVLDKGRIVGYGTNEKLLEECGQYKKLYELQFVNN